MIRALYVLLLRVHPRPFRRKFADEMRWIFDQEAAAGRSFALLIDAFVSLAPQWVLRPDFTEPYVAVGQSHSVSMFHLIESPPPRAAFLLHVAALSFALFAFAAYSVMRGGAFPPLILGTHHQSPHLLGVERSSIEPAELTTEVKLRSPAVDPLEPAAAVYFHIIFVLRGSDADEDLILSPGEIAQAPAALRKLDWNDDGKLSPVECGLHFGTEQAEKTPERSAQIRTSDVRIVRRARFQFMQFHPVLSASDTDRNGEISASEIAASSRTLRPLDRNRDGSLEPADTLPNPVESRAAIYFSRVDANTDGIISAVEASSAPDDQTRALLSAADRNHDGAVTGAELLKEVRLRIERENQLRNAFRIAGDSSH